jgi:hypothetical protein
MEAGKGRLDRVEIRLSRRVVRISWDSRTELLARLRRLESAGPIVRAFEAVGASRPVELDREQKATMYAVLDVWLQNVPVDEFPEDVMDLRYVLDGDLTQEGSGRA